MGTDRTPNQMRGFISPLKFTVDSFWMDETTAQQNTPRAGAPVASQNSPMVLQSSGTMSESDTVQVRTVRAGHVGLNGRSQLQWRAGTSGSWYGRDAYNICSWWERVTGSNTLKFIPRDALQATDGSIYISSEKQDSGTYDVMIIKRDVTGSYQAAISLYSITDSKAEDFLFSGLAELEDGSIICAHWTIDPDDELAQVNIHRTEDEGATWSLVSTDAIPNDGVAFPLSIENKGSFGTGTAGSDLSKIRIKSIGGQTLLTAHVIRHDTSLSTAGSKLYQFLSTNQGLTFDLVATNEDAGYFSHDLQVVNGIFHISYIEYPASPRALVIGALASATSPISSSIKYDISTDTNYQNGTPFTHEGELSVWIDTDGKYYAIARVIQGSSAAQTTVFQSDDGGKNWSSMGIGGSSFVGIESNQINNFSPSSNLNLINFVGCSQGGEGLLFHNTAGTGSSSYSEILGCYQIGGYSTVTAPPYQLFSDDTRRMRWAINWIGVQLPDALGWTVNGAATAALQNGYVNLTTGAGDEKYYSRALASGDLDSGMIARLHIKVTTGVILKPVLQVQISDGSTTSYKVSIRASATQLDLYDEEAGARIGSLKNVDMTEEADLLLAVSSSNVYAWYRGTATGTPRTWVEIANSSSLTSGTATSRYIYFGAIDTASTRDISVYECHMSYDTHTGRQLAFGQTDRELWSRPYPALGYSVKLDNNLFIMTRDGATQEVDQWQIEPKFDYPVENILYSISPTKRTTWKTPASAGPIPSSRIALYIDPSEEKTELENDMLGVCLENINFQNFLIRAHDGTSWATVATVDNKAYQGSFSRTGATIRSTAASGAIDHPYFFYNECQGWRVKLDDGGDNVQYRKIASNSEGPFITTSSKFAVLTLEGIDGTEPTSGTATIIPDSIAVLMYLENQYAVNYRDIKAIGIEISTQETVEDYFQMGMITAGPMLIPGRQYSRGRRITELQGIEDVQTLDGTVFTRNTGNNGRSIQIAWADGVDISDLYSTNTEPNYWKGSNRGDAIANVGDAPTVLQGFYRYLEGSLHQTVYIPAFTTSIDGSNQTQILNRRGDHMTCRITDPIQITNVLGDELQGLGNGEVFRVATIQLDEVK